MGGSRGQEIENHPGQHGETPSLLKIQKIIWARWCVPVIPATREAEARELPEPRRQKLWLAGIAPLHSSLGNKSETPSQKKRKTKTKQYTEKQQNCSEYNLSEKIYNALFYFFLEYIHQLHRLSHVKYRNSIFKRIEKNLYII